MLDLLPLARLLDEGIEVWSIRDVEGRYFILVHSNREDKISNVVTDITR